MRQGRWHHVSQVSCAFQPLGRGPLRHAVNWSARFIKQGCSIFGGAGWASYPARATRGRGRLHPRFLGFWLAGDRAERKSASA